MTTPTVTVKLDDGTGTYPTDISAFVRLVEGVGVDGFGRGNEFDKPAPATLTFVLDNTDGRFTVGASTLSPGTPVRFSGTIGATHSDRCTGRVSSLTLGWPSGGQEFAILSVQCVDPLADLSRRPMRSMLEEEILFDDPIAYYTLGEAEGATSAGDTSGNQAPVVTISGSGPALAFGGGTGPVDGGSAVKMNGSGATSGRFLIGTPPAASAAGAFSVECWFSITATLTAFQSLVAIQDPTATSQLYLIGANGLSGLLSAFVGPAGNVVSSGPRCDDGSTHHAVLTYDGATTLKLYQDGQLVGSSTSISPHGLVPSSLTIGTDLDFGTLANTQVLNGSISHVALYSSVLSPTRAASHAGALTGFAETTDVRLSRLASYVGLTATTNTPSGQQMGSQATSGQSLFDAMQTVAAAEGGVMFSDGSGDLVMQGRYYRGLKATPDLTLTADDLKPDTGVTWDTQQKINQVAVTRTGGATQTVSAAAVLADRSEPVYPTTLDLSVADDDDALAAAQWTLAKHTDTTPRLASVTLDLLTSPNAAAILALAIGDRLSLTPAPSQMYAAGDYTVEGWSEIWSLSEVTRTLNLLPWELSRVFILDDPVYGRLDFNPLGY